MTKFVASLAVCLLGQALLAGQAQAYVDPGIGGMFYQVLVLVIAVVGGFLAVFRNKLRSLFGSKGPRAEDVDDDPEP